MSELFVLDLKETAAADRIRTEGTGATDADRIGHYLASQGVTIDPEHGVTIMPGGLVQVWAENDPAAVWEGFTNAPTPEATVRANRLVAVRAAYQRLKAGTASMADRDLLLRALVVMALEAYGIRED